MSIKVKVKAKEKDGIVKAKMLIKHPMESGLRKNKEGILIPVHHLKEVKAEYQGVVIFQAEIGVGVAKDPFMAFSFKGTKGELFSVSALDSKGETGITETVIK